jgi:hypothetical protein
MSDLGTTVRMVYLKLIPSLTVHTRTMLLKPLAAASGQPFTLVRTLSFWIGVGHAPYTSEPPHLGSRGETRTPNSPVNGRTLYLN